MKNKKVLIVVILIILALTAAVIIGMASSRKANKPQESEKPKVLFYRNPMNPEITSPVPMKDQMGMDYVPVYEEKAQAAGAKKGVYVSPEKQELVGIQKEKIGKQHLEREIRIVGRIAYDPELYVAQAEYLQALKAKDSTADSSLPVIKQQMDSMIAAAEKRLLLLGMNKDQIKELAQKGQPQRNLYLPEEGDKAWVYMTIYESDAGVINESLPVEITAVAFPGEKFEGKIAALTPVVDPVTRTINARAEIDNPGNKLKPDMYVDVIMKVDLGEALAVPEEAVVDTGERQVVFVAKPDGYFEARNVQLGEKARNYYKVLSGLSEGEEVVTSGNFFIDSESKLRSAVTKEEHNH